MISVATNARDHEPDADNTIKSVLNQSFNISEIELLVVDDVSADTTRGVARSRPSIRHIRYDNKGQAAAVNLDFGQAKNDPVCPAPAHLETWRLRPGRRPPEGRAELKKAELGVCEPLLKGLEESRKRIRRGADDFEKTARE
jgi:hypothetical protein